MNIFVPHTWNDLFYQPQLLYMESVVFAIEQVNSRSDFLYGYKMELKNVFTHDIANIDYLEAVNMLTYEVIGSMLQNIPLLIGPNSNLFGSILPVLDKSSPLISYGVTSTRLEKTENLFKTVPSDHFRMQVLYDLLKRLGWNYLSVISSGKLQSTYDARMFLKQTDKLNVCVNEYVPLAHSSMLRSFINKSYNEGLKGIIAFTYHDDSLLLLQEVRVLIKKKGLAKIPFKIIWFYGATDFLYFAPPPLSDHRHLLNVHSLSIELSHEENIEFRSFAKSRNNPQKAWRTEETLMNQYKNVSENYVHLVRSYINLQRSCISEKCSGYPYNIEWMPSRQPYTEKVPVNNVIHAVYAGAMALRILIEKHCNKDLFPNQSHCTFSLMSPHVHKELLDALNSMSRSDKTILYTVPWDKYTKPTVISYDLVYHSYNGRTFNSTHVGLWSINRSNLSLSNEKFLELFEGNMTFDHNKTWLDFNFAPICNEPCSPGYISQSWKNKAERCCWNCIKCPNNSIVINNTCVACKSGSEKADLQTMNCSKLPKWNISFITFPNHLVALTIFILLGFLLDLLCIVIVLRCSNYPIFDSSWYQLWIVYLVGVIFQKISAVLFLIPATSYVCVSRNLFSQSGINICFLTLVFKICATPLLLQSNNHSSRKPIVAFVLLLSFMPVIAFNCIVMQASPQYVSVTQVATRYDMFSTDTCESTNNISYSLIGSVPCITFMVAMLVALRQYRNLLHVNYYEGWSYVCMTTSVFLFSFASLGVHVKLNAYNKDLLASTFNLLKSYSFLLGVFVLKLFFCYSYRNQVSIDRSDNQMTEGKAEFKLRRRVTH